MALTSSLSQDEVSFVPLGLVSRRVRAPSPHTRGRCDRARGGVMGREGRVGSALADHHPLPLSHPIRPAPEGLIINVGDKTHTEKCFKRHECSSSTHLFEGLPGEQH